jgi:hypothetical protein
MATDLATPGARLPFRVLVVDLYGDGDVLRLVLDTDANRKTIREWEEQDAPMDFSSWMADRGIVEFDFEVMRLSPN